MWFKSKSGFLMALFWFDSDLPFKNYLCPATSQAIGSSLDG
jgi:hypothetical protein